jgi:serine/threonine protein kinase
MLCCLNPECDRPINPDAEDRCQNCGIPLATLLYNRFKIAEPIGRGGFGKTYLAEDTHKLNEQCVVKQLVYQSQGNMVLQQKVVQLFEQEAKHLQQLGENPQIPTLLAYFEENGYLYLVQQFVAGDDLLKYLEKEGKFNEEQIRHLLLDLLPVLQFVHDRDTIHRDIKPGNIICRSKDNKPVLIDFGVSKLISQTVVGTSVGTSLGSHGYSPLEQIRDGKAVYASDLFALGATCFHLMSGIHPFHLWTDNGFGWVTDWRKHVPHPITAQLGHILDKLLQKDVQDRYQSAAEVLQDLQSQSAIAPTVPFAYPPASPDVSAPPSRSLSGGDSKNPKSRKSLKLKLAVVFGLGAVSIAVTIGLKVNEPKVTSSTYSSRASEASPASTSPPVAATPAAPAAPTTPAATPNTLSVRELVDLGIDKSNKGDKRGAIADFTKAIELDPKHAVAYNNRGNARADLSDNQGAIADYTKAIELNPTYAIAYTNRGFLRHSQGDRQGAIADFTKAIEIDPKYAPGYITRGSFYYESGDPKAANLDWRKAIALDAKETEAYIALAVSLYTHGTAEDRTESIQLVEKAIQLDKRYSNLQYLDKEKFWSVRMLEDAKKLFDDPQVKELVSK